MSFNVKINALMKALNVANNHLAKVLSVDPSLISRWRNGTRFPVNNSAYIKEIANYFASIAKKQSQKAAIYEVLGLQNLENENNTTSLVDLLHNWLNSKSITDEFFCENYTTESHFSKKLNTNTYANTCKQIIADVFYGTEGKRNSVLRFLNMAEAADKPVTLLLHNDENMAWLIEDKKFYQSCTRIMSRIISKGHRIKVIHTIQRDFSEMSEAIKIWFPLYMTGAVEAYYYPNYHDNIIKRTMFIIPEVAALISSSTDESYKNAHHYFITDIETINNFSYEFYYFLNKCRSLMQTYIIEKHFEFYERLQEFYKQPEEYISVSNHFTTIAMSDNLFEHLINNTNLEDDKKKLIKNMHKVQHEHIDKYLSYNPFTEIVRFSLWDMDNMNNSSLNMLKPACIFGIDLAYESLRDYCEHLTDTIKMLTEYNNYHLILCSSNSPQDSYISVKQDTSVIVVKQDSHPLIFTFERQNMVTSFYEFLGNIVKTATPDEKDKHKVIKQIRDLLGKLETLIN